MSDTVSYAADLECARGLDAADALAPYRERFHIPRRPDGQPVIYFCGNSLGLQPRDVERALLEELEDWRQLAVHAHFQGRHPWYSYHELFRETGARLVGALPGEVVMMNSLTTNLHLLLVSFYRPTAERAKILIEDAAFPSDIYAVKSQLRFHGRDPETDLVVAKPRVGESWVRTEDLEELLAVHGERIALVLLGGVNYFSGQLFDLARITRAAQARGCVVGFDLAHAAGNAELRLHDWNVDFAVWCSYKYLNSGPGAVAGCFVHERHGRDHELPRFAGWWGNDPQQRFQMHLMADFEPQAGADGWQLSNPPILALAPLRVSLDIFDHVGMAALRAKSVRLTGYLEYLLDRLPGGLEILTPRAPGERGCQLSIRVPGNGRATLAELERAGVVCDFRAPDVIRVAPVPLYNSFEDVFRFASYLGAHTGG
ncbi:MAG: kynureninase [Planctomycetota bacterium]